MKTSPLIILYLKKITETSIFFNIEDILNYQKALVFCRVGNYKLIEGFAGLYNGWYPVPTSENDATVEGDAEGPDYYQLYDVISKSLYCSV